MRSAFYSTCRIALLLLGSVWLLPMSVSADAVPPPPDSCPRGQIPITSHAGPQCVLPPPKDCPPGWRAEIRGVCRLESCTKDADCGAGHQCREADLCLHEYLQEWGFTKAEPGRNRPLFAGPPQRFDPPRRIVEAIDVCAEGRACPEIARCGRAKVCLPTGVSRPGIWKGSPGPAKDANRKAR